MSLLVETIVERRTAVSALDQGKRVLQLLDPYFAGETHEGGGRVIMWVRSDIANRRNTVDIDEAERILEYGLRTAITSHLV